MKAKDFKYSGAVAFGLLVMTLIDVQGVDAQIEIPQASPYTNDANTVLLQHFDGSTTGTTNGLVTYDAGIFGQGVRMKDTSYITWNFGALSQGTVEYWFKLDNLTNSFDTSSTNSEGVEITSANYSGLPQALTMVTAANYHLQPYTSGAINRQPFDWVGAIGSVPITSNRWYHYALTWGSVGLKLYLNGKIVGGTNTPTALNSSTGQWSVGAEVRNRTDGFNGVMDELRISNVQREFIPFVPQVNIAPYPDPSSTTLQLDWQTRIPQVYDFQASANLLNWTSAGNLIIGNGTTTNFLDVPVEQQKFYRLQVQ